MRFLAVFVPVHQAPPPASPLLNSTRVQSDNKTALRSETRSTQFAREERTSMLLDEDPAALIHECIQNFSTAPDRAALSRIASSLSTLSAHRTAALAAQRSNIKRQQRHLNGVQQSHDLSLASHNPTEHAQSMIALDRQKFRLAKEASDLEIEGERLEGEVGSADEQLRQVESGGSRRRSAISREESDGLQSLKIKLYRSLGADFEGEGADRRIVVRNTRHGNVEILNPHNGVDADRFWQAL